MRREARERLTFALALAFAAPVAAPVMAATPAAPSAAEVDGAVERALTLGQDGDCSGALKALDPLVAGLAPGELRNRVQLARLACLGPAGREAEVAPVQRELATALPRNPLVRSFGVVVALAEGRSADSARALIALADQDPAALKLFPADTWRALSAKLVADKAKTLRDDAEIALARAEWEPTDDPSVTELIARDAIAALLARGSTDEAQELLARVDMPELLVDMATLRSFAPIWPAIEAKLGPQGAHAIDDYAATALRAFAATPDDPAVRRDAVRAFLMLGRLQEAIDTAAAVQVTPGIGDADAETVRLSAAALAADGKRDAAIERLRPFAALGAQDVGVSVIPRIVLAEMLDEARHEDEALTSARESLSKAGAALTPWGEAWLHRTELCALSALGRTTDARVAGDALKAHAADNQAAAIEGLLCARRDGEAAALAVATLATVDGADTLSDQFQPGEAIWPSSDSRLRALWQALLRRPDVKAAFDRRVRILPRSLWPSRTPRPIPVVGTDASSTT